MAFKINQEKQDLSSTDSKYLIYINAEVGSVFRSQVAELLFYYAEKQFFEKIILLCGIRNIQEQKKVEKIFALSHIQLQFFKTYPNYYFFNFLQQKEISDKIKTIDFPKEQTVVHIRGELLALHCKKGIKKKFGSLSRTLVDIRGAGWEETIEFQGGLTLKNRFKKANYTAAFRTLTKFGAVSAVSKALCSYLGNKNPDLKNTIHLIPCLVSETLTFNRNKRETIRKELNLGEEDKLMVFSSGGTAAWQQNETLFDLLSPHWVILNLSPVPINKEGIINQFVSYDKVADYLSASDAALIFRSPSVVNKVACPVKFCEYLNCGLPVISDANVEMISDYIHSEGHGQILNRLKDIHQLPTSTIFKGNREEIMNQARATFGIEKIATQYLQIYFSLK